MNLVKIKKAVKIAKELNIISTKRNSFDWDFEGTTYSIAHKSGKNYIVVNKEGNWELRKFGVSVDKMTVLKTLNTKVECEFEVVKLSK